MFLTHRLRGNELLDEGTIVVCDALRESKVSRIEELDLSYNRIGLPGAESVAAYVAVTASLTSVNLLSNKMDIESATMLLKVKAEKSMLRTLCGLTHEETEINLNSQGLGPADAMLLAPEVSVMTSLTKILVSWNELGDEGTTILCDAIRESTVSKVEELDLERNEIGPNGAKAIAALCADKASLTSVWTPAHKPMPLPFLMHAAAMPSWIVPSTDHQLCTYHCLQLNLSDNLLGPKGAEALAPALVKTSLTKIE